MLSAGFSSSVLRGMVRQGFDKGTLAKLTGLPPARVTAVLVEKARLTDKQLDAIEDAARMTGGQLAALHIEPHGGPYTELANKLATYRCRPYPKKRVGKKRAG